MRVTDLKGIEKFFCSSWDGWDEVDTGILMFYSPTVHPEVQELTNIKGVIEYITVNTQDCTVDFYYEDEACVTLDFKVLI